MGAPSSLLALIVSQQKRIVKGLKIYWGGCLLVLLAAVHAVVYAAYVWLAGRAGSVFASQCAYLVTGSGVVWAMALLGERFQPVVWLALAMMLAGVALVQPRAARKGA